MTQWKANSEGRPQRDRSGESGRMVGRTRRDFMNFRIHFGEIYHLPSASERPAGEVESLSTFGGYDPYYAYGRTWGQIWGRTLRVSTCTYSKPQSIHPAGSYIWVSGCRTYQRHNEWKPRANLLLLATRSFELNSTYLPDPKYIGADLGYLLAAAEGERGRRGEGGILCLLKSVVDNPVISHLLRTVSGSC